MRVLLRSLMVIAAFCLCLRAHALSYDAVYVFGDSLSDNGNIPAASPYRPPAPYFDGRFSHGLVAVEYLTTQLGLPGSALHDYAVGGATTGLYNADIPTPDPLHASGVLSQVTSFQAQVGSADPSVLYVLWAGANDFLGITNPLQLPAATANAVNNIVDEVALLHGMGAQHILVPNMPDLGLLPATQSVHLQATFASTLFNSTLAAELPDYVTQFDTFGLFHQVLADPAAFGFSDVTNPCILVAACLNGSADEQAKFLFWDGVHPTTSADRVLANRFASSIGPVPEPGTAGLLALGLLSLWATRAAR